MRKFIRVSRPFTPAATIVAFLLVAVLVWPEAPADDLDPATQQLLVDAVQAAFEVDLFNSRCRSDMSGRRTENLNKELVSRYRMTVLDVQDDLFPEGYYRDAQARMESDFRSRLRDIGGCPGAKEQRWRDTLQEHYDRLMAEIARQP
jgi:hypothetical protein